MATDARYFARNIESSDSRSVESIVTDGLEFRREYEFLKARGVVECITVNRGHAARKRYTRKRGVTVECVGCDARCSARNGNCFKRRTIIERIRIQSGKTCSQIYAFKLRAVLECIAVDRSYFIIKYNARDVTASVKRCRRNACCIRNRYGSERGRNVIIIALQIIVVGTVITIIVASSIIATILPRRSAWIIN